MVKEKYYEASEILAGLVHPQGEVTNDKLTGPAEELQIFSLKAIRFISFREIFISAGRVFMIGVIDICFMVKVV